MVAKQLGVSSREVRRDRLIAMARRCIRTTNSETATDSATIDSTTDSSSLILRTDPNALSEYLL